MNYYRILKYDTANGPGIRTTIWFTGCIFHCSDCFNSEIRDFKAGKLFDEKAKEELFSYLNDSHTTGLSVLGGEPLAQDIELANLLKEVKETYSDKNIWMWTGFQLKDIMNMEEDKKEHYLSYIRNVDYLVDGPFEKDNTKYHTRFRGSSNQIIWHIHEKDNQLIAENVSHSFDEHTEDYEEIKETIVIR